MKLRSHGEELAEANFPVAAAAVGVMFAAFLLQLVWPRRVFKLILKTHGGDVEALASSRGKFVIDAKQAVEAAFIARAHHHSQKESD
jgi:hypothetical protein